MNNTKSRFFLCIFAMTSALFFTACPTESENQGIESPDSFNKSSDGVYVLDFTNKDGNTKYLSLSTGEWVDDPYSTNWDMAFEGTRLIYTNSGDTAKALASGGDGGVWYTNQINFDAVTCKADAIVNDTDLSILNDYHQDAKRWTVIMSGPRHKSLNVMTFTGYENEGSVDGKTEATRFSVYHKYNKKQFYQNEILPDGSMLMPPNFTPTRQVYIVKHGNGVEYSKVQISEFVRDSINFIDTYQLTWKLLEE
jgi:hypothetical protein